MKRQKSIDRGASSVRTGCLGLALGLILSLSLRADPGGPEDKPRETVRVAGIVLKWIAGDREGNFVRAERLVREAARNGARIVATPEAFLDGYAVRNPYLTDQQFRDLAEPIPEGPYFRRMQALADELDIYFVAAISELEGESVFNSALVLGPDGRLLGVYRKHFLWQDEKARYLPGSSFPVFETEFGKLGLMICYDRQHRAAISALAEAGAELVIVPSGGGYGPSNDATVAQRSKEGRVPIVFVHPIEFLVTGRDGEILTTVSSGTSLDDDLGSDPGVVRYFDVPLGL